MSVESIKGRVRWGENFSDHLDLHQCLITVVQEISSLSAVYADNTQKELATQPQRQGCLALINNGMHTTLDVGLEDMRLGQFALKVGGEPHSSQWPSLG